jgi:2-polyprenyl-6-methoxyphenol hydroxylase-like FAD-dependent oxidoreductase
MAMNEKQKTHVMERAHAVVIGGSMAGLLASRVLADYFDTVSIIERDHLTDSVEPRKGVPQGRHLHGILKRGAMILEQLFPNFISELMEGGASEVDNSGDLGWHHRGLWKLREPSGIVLHTQSRPFLEWNVRRRVSAYANVRFIDQCDAKRFDTNADRSQITGVIIQRRDNGAAEQSLPANLVVDASGRGSHSPRWLEDLGYAKPEESVITVNVGYATRIYRRLPSHERNWKALMLYPTPPHGKRMGMLFPIEGNRWIATLIGWVGDHPPTDDEGFLEFARNLETPELYHLMQEAEPLTPIVFHRFPSNLRRHYERMRRFPGGLIVLGDSLCSFNPSYGQGMTTSALAAMTLKECLEWKVRKGMNLNAMTHRFRKKAWKVLQTPWMQAAGEDLSWPEAEGEAPFGTAFMNWYFSKVHELSACDKDVHVRFLAVANMIDPLYKIFHPRVLLRVLTYRSRSEGKAAPIVSVGSAAQER